MQAPTAQHSTAQHARPAPPFTPHAGPDSTASTACPCPTLSRRLKRRGSPTFWELRRSTTAAAAASGFHRRQGASSGAALPSAALRSQAPNLAGKIR